MIANPDSIHTRTWIAGLQNCGVTVTVLFVKDWMKEKDRSDDDLGVETILLDSPTKKQMISTAFRHLSFGPLSRDLRNKTRLHQELKVLGRKIRDIAESLNVDFIHAHGVSSSALLAGASGFHPFSASAWGSDIYVAPMKYPYLLDLVKEVLSSADFVQVESKMSADRVEELSSIDDEKLLIGTWGVNVDDFNQDHQDFSVLDQFSISESKFILSFRSLEPIYQIHLIIEAFNRVAEQYNNVKLVIGSDGSEKESLANLVHQFDLTDRVIFTGYVDLDTKKSLFSNAYCYIQCPSSDGVAITVMEAMASGLPIISSDAGENRILVKNGINGYLIEQPFVDGLEKAMKDLLNNEALRNQMGSESRKYAEKNLSRQGFFNAYYNKVLQTITSSLDT